MQKRKTCDKCNKLVSLEEKNGVLYEVCACGKSKFIEKKIIIQEKEKKKDQIGKGIAEEDNSLDGFPHTCSKCGYSYADITDLGAPYGDESNIYLLKCRKCKHTERQTDGTGNQR
jgi:DNA-directed RNA polymerase subunit M/transcription elongation factor TFIIS